MAGYLEASVFRTVVTHAPLIAIDLVVLNDQGHVLLGKHMNRPAQGYWFTPGGRIRKNESLESAFRRTTRSELGVELPSSRASFRGVYEHFYKNSLFSDDENESGTHYVVLAYTLNLVEEDLKELPSDQHLDYCWVDLCTTKLNVHKHVRDYFSQG